ncbi:MAG: ABC transporter substrate-binding protein [Holosporales bacterium]
MRFLTVIVTLLSSLCAHAAESSDVKVVAITQIVAHPALDAVRKGALDELEARGYIEGRNLKVIYQSASGNPTTAAQIAQQFVGLKPDVIFAISTPSAQTVQSASRGTIPMVFAAISDPQKADIVDSEQKPGRNTTGVTDRAPLTKQLQFVRDVMPQLKKLAFLYNPGEDNSVAALQVFKDLAKASGIELKVYAASKTAEVSAAARRALEECEAVFVPTDNTIASAFEAVVKTAQGLRKPVFASDTILVGKGAVAMIGQDYTHIGREAGMLLSRVLAGEPAGSIPVVEPGLYELAINKKAAEAARVNLPKTMIDAAQKVYP